MIKDAVNGFKKRMFLQVLVFFLLVHKRTTSPRDVIFVFISYFSHIILLPSDKRQESPLLVIVNSVENPPAAVGDQNGRRRTVHYSAESHKSVLNVYLGVYFVRVFERNGLIP